MFSHKKIFLTLLALFTAQSGLIRAAAPTALLASKPKVTTTTTTTTTKVTSGKPSDKASVTIPLPFSKEVGKDIEIGLVLFSGALTIYGFWKFYQYCGGPATFEDFLDQAAKSAKSAVAKQEAANKQADGAKYQPLDDNAKAAITERAYEGYFSKQSAKLFGVSEDNFTKWFQSLGATTKDRLDIAKIVVNELAIDPNRTIDGARAGEQPFKSAARYAVDNNILTHDQASAKIKTFKPRAADSGTGEGTAYDVGRAIRGAVGLAGDGLSAAGSAAADAARAGVNVARQIPDRITEVRDGFVAGDQSASVRPGLNPSLSPSPSASSAASEYAGAFGQSGAVPSAPPSRALSAAAQDALAASQAGVTVAQQGIQRAENKDVPGGDDSTTGQTDEGLYPDLG